MTKKPDSTKADKTERRIRESEITGLKYFDKLTPLLQRLHDDGCQRDQAGNRQLHFDRPFLIAEALLANRFAFGIQSGATDFLAKPLVLESMIVRLWSILQHRGFVPPPENETLKELLRSAPMNPTPIPAGMRGGSAS